MNQLQTKSSASVIKMSIGICLGGLVLIYNLVCFTEIANLYKLKNQLNHDEYLLQASIITSCVNAGALLSPIFYLPYVKWIGELKGLLLIDTIGILVILLQMVELSFLYLALGRLLLGVVLGLSTSIVPVFLNSISPPMISGKIGSLNQLFQVSGVTFAFLAGYLIDDEDPKDEWRWRIFLAIPIIPFLLRIIILQFFYPFNTVEYMIQNNQDKKLRDFCLMVYQSDNKETVQQLKKSKILPKAKTQQTATSTFQIRFYLALVVIASNQLSGINAIFFYLKQLLGKVTRGNNEVIQNLMFTMSIVQILSTLLSIFTIDKIGRKKLILSGQYTIIMALLGIFLSDYGLSFYAQEMGDICIVGLLFVHILVFNFTLGPVCIVYCAEIIQDITWIIITIKLISLTIALVSDYMIQYLGIGVMFLVFAILTAMANFYLSSRLKETQGLTTAQIHTKFQSSSDVQEASTLLPQ